MFMSLKVYKISIESIESKVSTVSIEKPET